MKTILVSLSVLALASVAYGEPIKCQRAIASASAKFVQTEQDALQKCVAARRKAGNPPAGTLAACKADAKVAKALSGAASQLKKSIDSACGGKKHKCGSNSTGEDSPASIGWLSACPNFENGACVNQIFDCRDITTCIQCIGESAVDETVTQNYESFQNEAGGTAANKCQQKISTALTSFFKSRSTALQKCWDDVLQGKSGYSKPCPAGDSSGKTQTTLDKAEETKVKAICAACGGKGDKNNDGQCDAVGFDPQNQIGFGATCPSVQVPGGGDCGAIGTVDTLQKYISCVDCLAEFKVDCLDRNAVPGEIPYPSQCNPASTISLSNGIAIGKDLEAGIGGSLGFPAPAGNLTVTITSSDAAHLLLSTSTTGAGSASITLTVGAGSSTIPTFFAQALASSGTVDVTATAPDYAAGTTTVTLNPSGFITWNGDFTTTSYAADSALGVYSVRLDPGTLAYAEEQPVRGGLSVNVPITSASPSVGTITGSPAVFNGGDYYNYGTAFHPVGPGSSLVSINTPPGFSTPTNYQQLTATVTLPHLYMSYYYCYGGWSGRVGRGLETGAYVCLDTAPPSPITITVTSSDGTVATLSTDATAAGGNSVSFSGVSGQSAGPFVVQGLGLEGSSTTLTATAPGYADGTATVNVDPAGFVVWNGDFSTTTYSADTSLSVASARLDPGTLAYAEEQPVSGGLSVNVPVNSASPSVGTITGSPAVFNGGDYYNYSTAFHPVSPGSSVVSINTPTGFSTPSNYQQLTATVTLPHIYMSYYYCGYGGWNGRVGRGLETGAVYVCLDVAPPSPITITVTSSDGTVAALSTDATVAGGNSVSFSGVSGTSAGPFVVQGTGLEGSSTTLTVTASGYADGTATVNVDPAGFVVWNGDFSTTTYSADTSLSVASARLDPGTLAYAEEQPVSGGLSVNVPVNSASPSVGTITGSPAVFNGGDYYNYGTAFHPVSPGSSVVSINTPTGFTMPSNYQQLTATVTLPHIYMSYYYCGYGGWSGRVGRGLETGVAYVCLDVAPPSPISITVTSSDGTVATLSTDATVAGGNSVSFSGVSGTSAGPFVVQGQGLASTTLTAHASGYMDGTAPVTVDPAGFVMWNGDFATTVSSPDTSIYLASARLDPITLNYAEVQPVRGGLTVDVPVNTHQGTGTIIGSPAVFNGGDSSNSTTAFHPASAGTDVISLGVPSEFSMPSNYQDSTVTVTP